MGRCWRMRGGAAADPALPGQGQCGWLSGWAFECCADESCARTCKGVSTGTVQKVVQALCRCESAMGVHARREVLCSLRSDRAGVDGGPTG